MSGERPVRKTKAEAIHEWPCDGVARFKVGSQVLAYGEAYAAIFAESCGTTEPGINGGPTRRIHTNESVRRLTLLNIAYAGPIKAMLARAEQEHAAKAKDKFEELKAGVEWNKNARIAYSGDCPLCSRKIEDGKVVLCLACFDAIADADKAELGRLYNGRDKAGLDAKLAALKSAQKPPTEEPT